MTLTRRKAPPNPGAASTRIDAEQQIRRAHCDSSPPGNLLDLPFAVPGEVHGHPARRRAGRHRTGGRLDRPLPPARRQPTQSPTAGRSRPAAERYYADGGEEPGRWLGRTAQASVWLARPA